MASLDHKSNEDKIKDLLEEIDLHKFIRDDYLSSVGECKEAEEVAETLRSKEIQLAELLGDPVPPPPAASTPSVISPTPHNLTSTPAPPPLPSGGFAEFAGELHRMLYWSSAAPSPFAISRNPAMLAASPVIQSPDNFRKRPRPTSGSSPTLQESSKRNALSQPASRQSKLEELDSRQQAEIASHQRHYDNLIRAASDSAEALTLQQERDDLEKDIMSLFQLDKDAEIARGLQYDEDHSQYLLSQNTQRPSWDIPHRTPHVKTESGSNGVSPFKPHTPSLPFSQRGAHSDDDFEEITADAFKSRFGDRSSFNNPYLLSSSPYGQTPYEAGRSTLSHPPVERHLPWNRAPYGSARNPLDVSAAMPGLIPGPYDQCDAFEMIRNQKEIFDDDVDIAAYNEREFPDDIKNLLGGIKDIREATKADHEETPSALRVTLMKHQKIGLRWMKAKEESNHKGGILADDMGLGKTVQAIALMVARPYDNEERRANLIIAPKALMEQWKLEIERHVKPGRHQLSVLIYHSKRRPWRELNKYDVVITTFGTLTAHYKTLLDGEKMAEEGRDASRVRDMKARAGPLSPGAQWHRVIIDEAQNIKNSVAKSAMACCRLRSTYRWCLTGTPMMNRLEDFQSLLGFLRIKPYNNPKKFKSVST